jgi:transcriptional activator SPT7
MSQDPRPRKRTRRSSSISCPKHRVELWWDVIQSDQLLGNGLPVIRHSTSEPTPSSSSSPQTKDPPPHNPITKRKKRKKVTDPQSAKTLLSVMNNNIRTMHRLRNIHARFSNIKDSNPANNEESGLALPGPPPSIPEPIDLSNGPSLAEKMSRLEDTNPWTELREVGGVDIGSGQAEKCLNWMGGKVLEHVGFQGAFHVLVWVSGFNFVQGLVKLRWRCCQELLLNTC